MLFAKPSLIRNDLEAVLSTMVDDKVGTGEIVQQYAKSLAEQYNCYGAIVFRDMLAAASKLYALLAARNKSALLFSPLTDSRWIDAARNYTVAIRHAALVADTIIADYGAVPHHTYDAVFMDSTLGYIPDYGAVANSGKMIVEIIGAGLGGVFNKKYIGTFGDIVVIELEADGIMTCGGGTALLCRRKEDYMKLRDGIRGSVIPDINAALGMAQLKRLSHLTKKRKATEALYLQRCSERALRYAAPFSKQYVPHSFVIRYKGNRKELQRFARSHGVETKRAFENTVATHYRNTIDIDEIHMAYIDEVLHQTVLFPLYPQLSVADTKKIERMIANLP